MLLYKFDDSVLSNPSANIINDTVPICLLAFPPKPKNWISDVCMLDTEFASEVWKLPFLYNTSDVALVLLPKNNPVGVKLIGPANTLPPKPR